MCFEHAAIDDFHDDRGHRELESCDVNCECLATLQGCERSVVIAHFGTDGVEVQRQACFFYRRPQWFPIWVKER